MVKLQQQILTIVVIISMIVGSVLILNNVTDNAIEDNDTGTNEANSVNDLVKLPPDLKEYMETGIYPSSSFSERLIYTSTTDRRYDNEIIPPIKIGDIYVHFPSSIDPSFVRKLALDQTVKQLIPDYSVNYTASQSPSPNYSTESYLANDLLNTEDVWEEFGFRGEGVRIGIIDSGVDFGISDLVDSVILSDNGYAASFDPTGGGLAITSLTLSPEVEQGEEILPLEGQSLSVWLGERFELTTSQDLGISLENLVISDIASPSVSGLYKVGIAAQQGLTDLVPDQYFLFILTDSQAEGVYDTMYVDFDTSLAISLVQNGIILPSGRTYIDLVDFDLGDEEAFGPNNPIAARDIDGDGVNDVSMGALATAIDFNAYSGSLVVEGINPNGTAIGVHYDVTGHGTLTATATVAEGDTEFLIFDDPTTDEVENAESFRLPGSAPEAKIMSTKANTLFEFLLGWFWTAGLEFIEQDGQLLWDQNPDNLVDLTVNSWGTDVNANDGFLRGFDTYSLFLDFLTLPDELYEGFPGSIFVVSSGNSGPGFGTLSKPATASMAFSVGGSTYYHHINNTGKNDIAWFSSRGPTPYGLIKPDAVTPSDTGFVPVQVIRGLGNGTYASDTYGGTSEAAPRAAGIMALVLQAYRSISINPTFEDLRLAMKSTAIDLGFHSTQQGAGLLDAYQAVKAVLENKIVVSSDSTSQVAGERLQASFTLQFGDVIHPLRQDPIADFTQSITPEMLANGYSIDVRYLNGTVVPKDDFTTEVTRFALQSNSSFTLSNTVAEPTFNIRSLLPADWRTGDLLELSLSLTENSWDGIFNNGLQMTDVTLTDSVSSEIVSNTFSYATWSQLLYSGNPDGDFVGDPQLEYVDPGYIEQVSGWNGLTYQVHARVFSHTSWSALDITTFDGIIELNGTIDNELQFANLWVTTGNTTYNSPILIAGDKDADFGEDLEAINEGSTDSEPFQSDQISNTFDWNYRPGVGDYRYFKINVPDNATFLAVFTGWEDLGMQLNMYLFNSSGNLITLSDVEYIGGGFYESTSSEPQQQNLLVPAETDAYYLMVHVTTLPFMPGPFDIEVHARYLTIDALPDPEPEYSPDISSPIGDTLQVDASSYSIPNFPELFVSGIDVQVFQGREWEFNASIPFVDLQNGSVGELFTLNDFDYSQIVVLEAGEKIDITLTWEAGLDADIFVFDINDPFELINDQLNGLGSSPGPFFERAIFDAENAGSYIILVDYIDGELDEGDDFDFTISMDSRKGPTLSENGPVIDIPTDVFPDGDYGLWITLRTNFGIQFLVANSSAFENHQPFNFEMTSPQDGATLDNDVTLQWTKSDPTATVDVYVMVNGVQTLLGSTIQENDYTFDSSLFDNGPADLIVVASNGVYSVEVRLSVQFDNTFVSELPDITTTDNQSVNYQLAPLLGIVFLAIVTTTRRRQLQ